MSYEMKTVVLTTVLKGVLTNAAKESVNQERRCEGAHVLKMATPVFTKLCLESCLVKSNFEAEFLMTIVFCPEQTNA